MFMHCMFAWSITRLITVDHESFNTASVSLLLSLLGFQMGTDTILGNIPTYSVLSFHEQNLHLLSKEKRIIISQLCLS